MKRQRLAGRYGPDDQLNIPVNGEEQLTNLQLMASASEPSTTASAAR
jgi:hypothetical protein